MSIHSRLARFTCAATAGLAALLTACVPGDAPLKERAAEARPAGAATPAITVSPDLPLELNPGGGAPAATLDQAAAFAWQEFIALNWPAAVQNGAIVRDQAGTDCTFGDPDPSCATRPLVWQTFRGKAEIFSPLTLADYNNPPDYSGIYSGGDIPACAGFTPSQQQAWVNLDETSEISLAAMYAGRSAMPPPNSLPNSSPTLIRFEAKANRQEFAYARLIGANIRLPTGLSAATRQYVVQNGSPPAGATNLVSLPYNTIEIKTGWRQLGAGEDASRFHTTRVRYYEPIAPSRPASSTAPAPQCYYEATWAMVSLHIIQKTQSAPYFIYATFEHADNILNEDGAPTEDADGNIIASAVQPCRADQPAPCATTPTTVYQDSPASPPPPQVTTRSVPPPQPPATVPYCTPDTGTIPANRLYYLNTEGDADVPTGGYICINARQHPIPATIIAANAAAHAAIAAYNQANGIASSPWGHYKLINVQYVPMQLIPPGQTYTGQTYAGPDISTFYLSNSVVESNETLQNFSGRLVGGGPTGFTGAKSDYASQFGPASNAPVVGLYYLTPGSQSATGYNMGGCMGCHGTAQRGGSDFSFILGNGQVRHPEPIPQASRTGARGFERESVLIHWGR